MVLLETITLLGLLSNLKKFGEINRAINTKHYIL